MEEDLQHPSRVLDEFFYADEERDGFPAVEQSMIISEGDDHDGPDNNLAIDDDGPVFDGVHAEHGGLRQVDDRRSVQRTKHATVRATKAHQLGDHETDKDRPTW